MGENDSGKTHLLRRFQGKPYDPVKDAQTEPEVRYRSFSVRHKDEDGHRYRLRVRRGVDRGGSVANANESMVADIKKADVIIYCFCIKDFLERLPIKERVNVDLQTIWQETRMTDKRVILVMTFANDYPDKKQKKAAIDKFISHMHGKEWRDVAPLGDILLIDTQNPNDYLRVIERIIAKKES